MKYIASCSFGKDSLAAIITRIEHREVVDGAVYCRIMFDEEISAELPEHEAWIHEYAIPLLSNRYGIETTVVQSESTYCDLFHRQFKRGRMIGRIYGFPMLRAPWCNSCLKIPPIKKYQGGIGECSPIVGIALDEETRAKKDIVKGKILPLVDYGITEAETFTICKNADLLSPAYNGGRARLGCWFCHNQRVGELRRLRKEHPALWRKLMELDKESPVTFKPGKTLLDYDERFWCEDAQLTLLDCIN